MPNIPQMNSVWKAWGTRPAVVSNGKLSPQEALNQAQSQVETAIAGK